MAEPRQTLIRNTPPTSRKVLHQNAVSALKIPTRLTTKVGVPGCHNRPLVAKNTTMTFRINTALLCLTGLGICAQTHAVPAAWSYVGSTQADKWGDLDPDYVLCRSGSMQSPINIEATHIAPLPALDIHLTPGPATVKNNGYTLEVQSDTGGHITLITSFNSDDYTFEKMHLHTPSEMQIHGHTYPLAGHMVYRNKAGKQLVVAAFFEIGTESRALAPLLAALPRHKGDSLTLGKFDASDLFPAQRDYYTYEGSLTTPPCTEDIQWMVLKTPLTVSEDQMTTFQLLFPMNARPVQPVNKRTVLVSG